MNKIFLIFVLSGLAACSTYSKKECEVKDWYQEGFMQAREGQTEGKIAHYQKNCTEEHGVPVDQAKFSEGYQKGLSYFCTEQQGRNFGQQGKMYLGTCPKESEEKFLKTYESGRLDYLTQRVSSLENEVSDLRSRNSGLEAELAHLRGMTCQ